MAGESVLVGASYLCRCRVSLGRCNGDRRFSGLVNCDTIYLMKSIPLKFLHAYVLLSILLFGIVQSLKFFEIQAPQWVFSYLNDFLVIPIVLTVCLHGVWLIKKDRDIRLNIFTIFSMVVFYSIYFELYLPSVSDSYTGDAIDIICYFAGGIIFYFLQKIRQL